VFRVALPPIGMGNGVFCCHEREITMMRTLKIKVSKYAQFLARPTALRCRRG
jgi:hypothetical protein